MPRIRAILLHTLDKLRGCSPSPLLVHMYDPSGEWIRMHNLEQTWPCGQYLKLMQIPCEKMNQNWIIIPSYNVDTSIPCTAMLNINTFEWKKMDKETQQIIKEKWKKTLEKDIHAWMDSLRKEI